MPDSQLRIAEQIARSAHAGQKEESTGDDYIKHVERVVSIVRADHEKAAAWLHDVLEDSTVTAADLLAAGISWRVLEAVMLLTHVQSETYSGYIKRLKESDNLLAITVKIADLRDHLRPNCPKRLRPRYEKAWAVLCPDWPLP